MKYIEKYWIVLVIVFFVSSFINPAICFLILGSLFVYIGIVALLFLKKIGETGVKVRGRILAYQASNRGYKSPVIEFTPTGGETVTAKPFVYASTDLSKVRSYSKTIDTEVTVLYDPKDPTKFVLAGEQSFNYIVLTIVTLAGLFFVILGICIFLGYIKFGKQ